MVTCLLFSFAHSEKQKTHQYHSAIKKYSKIFKLDSNMVEAIIDVESKFNNDLVSNKGAIGLMQIVPQTAGIDVWRSLHGTVPSIEFLDSILRIPEQNIRLGCAYLALLEKRYFKDIENPLSKFYCLVAAYNTGSFNVAKTFIRKEDIEDYEDLSKSKRTKMFFNMTIEKINTMEHNVVKEHMKENLPYNETIVFLENVEKSYNNETP